MAILSNAPKTRDGFREYCLRKLGQPILEINVDPEQVEDRIDDALQFYFDYHFDGTEKIYYKHVVTGANRPGVINSIKVVNGGNNYSNSDTVVITRNGGSGTNAVATIVTNGIGTIISINVSVNGSGYQAEPTLSITTGTGSGADIRPILGGFIPMPENVIGAVKVFNVGGIASSSTDIFSINYQIALNDLYTLTSQSLIPYFMNRMHLSLIEELLVGQTAIRYNRHRNQLFLDFNWDKVLDGQFLLVEAYQVVDPDQWTDVWADRWLQKYAAALIKRQWGSNLTKFNDMKLPGGLSFNGLFIYTEAEKEIEKLEDEIINSYSLPVTDMIG